LLALQRAFTRNKKPYKANDIAARRAKLAVSIGGESVRIDVGSQPRAAKKNQKHDGRVVSQYIGRCCSTRNHMVAELVALGELVSALRSLDDDALKEKLQNSLMESLRSGTKTVRGLCLTNAGGAGGLAAEAAAAADRQTASVFSDEEVAGIFADCLKDMSAENYKGVILGGFESFVEELSNNVQYGSALHATATAAVATAKDRTAKQIEVVSDLQGQIAALLEPAGGGGGGGSGVVDDLELGSLDGAVDEASRGLQEALATACESLREQERAEREAGLRLDTLSSRAELDGPCQRMARSWRLLKKWYEPLLTNKAGWSAADHESAFQEWDKHFTEHYGQSTLAYVVNFRENHVTQMLFSEARYQGELTPANWSTQRSECCGKMIKDEARLLYGFANRGFNNADMIARRRHNRIYHYASTMAKKGTSKCSICRVAGHSKNNQSFHPIHPR
jgi:hypothetical protein